MVEVFFREWQRRAPGSRRDLGRARLLAGSLGLLDGVPPVLTVVGSKGKGTVATYASAFLTAAGLRVLTVTSPALRHNRERIRVDGQAVTEATLAELAARLDQPLPAPAGGYLSPSGLFLLAGVLHGRDVGAAVLVLEAGMGGRSDEVSLFPPTVLAIGPVFAEHLGVLGESPEEIAVEKAGVVSAATATVVSAAQTPEVAAAIARTVGPVAVEVIPGVADFRVAGAALGGTAAARLLEAIGAPLPEPVLAGRVLDSVRLPGRLSWHVSVDGETEILVDSAIDRTGVTAALRAAREHWPGGIDHVLLCLPDHKDLEGAIEALGDLPVTFVRLPDAHLRFTRPLPGHWKVIDAEDVTLTGFGHHVIALGTVYFTGRILDLVAAETDRLFNPPAR